MARNREFLLFVAAGGTGFAVDYLVVLGLVVGLGTHPMLARVFSFICAVWTTWLLNTRLTFAGRIAQGARPSGFFSYAAAMLLGLAANYAVYWVCLHWLRFLPEALRLLLAVGCGSAAGLGVNFLSCHKVLFKRRDRPDAG